MKSTVQLSLNNQVTPQKLQLPKISPFHQKENSIISIPNGKHEKKILFPSVDPDKVLSLTHKDQQQPESQRQRKFKNKDVKSIYENKINYLQKEDEGKEPLSQSSFRQKNYTNESNLILNNSQIVDLKNKSIDYFLHKNQLSLDVADSMKKLNNDVLSKSVQEEPITKNNLSQVRLLGANNPTHQSNSNIYYQNENDLYDVKGSYTNQRQSTSTNSIQKVNNSSMSSKYLQNNHSSQDQPMTKSQKGLNSYSNILEVNDKASNKVLSSEEKLQSQNSFNIFRLTDNNNDVKKLSEHQSNLLRALSICNPSKLDHFVKQNQSRIKEQKEHNPNIRKYELNEFQQPSTFNKYIRGKETQILQKKQFNNKFENTSFQKPTNVAIIQSEKDVEKLNTNSNASSFKNSQTSYNDEYGLYNQYKSQFKLNQMANEMEEQSKLIKQQQNQINQKLFYSHFDDSYQDITQLLSGKEESTNENQGNKFEKQNKSRFKKVQTIKTEFLYNIKQMLRMQRLREEKIQKEQIKQGEMMEYIKKRNQIQIILENSKQVKSLKEVADIIEKEIGIQNDKIANVLKVLIKNFGLEEYQKQYEDRNE